jgi:hypothetical protein
MKPVAFVSAIQGDRIGRTFDTQDIYCLLWAAFDNSRSIPKLFFNEKVWD